MIFNLESPYDKQRFKDYCNKLYEAGCVVEIKKKNPKRSLSQNSYLHVILSFFASEYGCSLEEVKVDFFKRTCNKEMFERKTVNKSGKEVSYLRSSSELDTGEMTLAIDRFRHWSAAEANIYLPAPHENQMLVYVQQQIEYNREYI